MLPLDLAKKSLEYWAALRSEASLVPSSHYFHTWLALAAFELGRDDMGEALLGDFLDLDESGHSEFNKLALIYVAERHNAKLSGRVAAGIDERLRDGRFSVDFTTRTGNNWLFLRTLIHLKLYLRFGSAQDLDDFRTYLDHVVGYFHDGLFFDYPPLREAQNMRAFPLTYSFKMLALLMECFDLLRKHDLESERQSKLRGLIEQALPVHLAFIAPDGEALYYGRSDNTLFGYANVLGVLKRLRPDERVEAQISAVDEFIRRNFVADGILIKAATPGFRDAYVFDSVYCAYFLARTLMLEQNKAGHFSPPAPSPNPVMQTPIGVTVRGKSLFAFISSGGCNLPQKGSDFSGFRYTGLTPMKLWYAGGGDAHLLSLNRSRLGPLKAEIPLLPLGRAPGIKRLPLVFDEVHVADNGTECKLRGHGAPVSFVAHAAGRRLIRRLGRNRPGLRSWLSGVPGKGPEIVRGIQINYATGALSIADHLPPGRWYYLVPAAWQVKGEKIRRRAHADGLSRVETTGGRVVLTAG